MKNKNMALIIALFIIFAILIVTTPFIGNRNASYIWILFLIIAIGLITVLAISSIDRNPHKIVEKFKKQPIIIQAIDVVVVLLIIYGIITLDTYPVVTIGIPLLFITTSYNLFYEK